MVSHSGRSLGTEVLIGGLLVLAVCWACPVTASAQSSQGEGPTPQVFLTQTTGAGKKISDIVPKRIGELLRDRLGDESGLDQLPSYAKIQSSSGGQKTGAVARAQKVYTSGSGLLEAADYEQASNKFQESVEILRSNMANVTKFDLYTDSLRKLARAYFESGFDFDARRAMTEFAHLEPDASLDPEKYDRELREIYSNEVDKIEKAGPGTLKVEADAQGATVVIDGEESGETPATVEGVSFGYHYVVVRHPTEGRWAKKIQFRGRGSTKTVTAELAGEGSEAGQGGESGSADLPAFYTEFLETVGDGQFGEDTEPYLEQIAAKTEADFITWTVMVKTEEGYQAHPFVYEVSTGDLMRAETVSFTLSLSNLMSGVGDLVDRIAGLVREPSEEKAVRAVTLVDPSQVEQSPAVAQTETESEASDETSASEGSSAAGEGAVQPPPEPSSSDDGGPSKKVLTYVGIGGAALLVGGLVTGGVLLFGDGGGKNQPDGFETSVSW